MQREVRFGIIGGGLMGREFASAVARWGHLLDYPLRPRIVAVASHPASTLDYFTRSLDTVKQATTDYRELLANPAVDAVYCAVPHDLHESFYTAIIHAGKHLLGEKPFGLDRNSNARILAAAAGRPDLVIRCSSEFPFFPGPQRIMKMIRENQFGRILEVECGFLHSSDMDPRKPANWKRSAASNGAYGCMGDLGMHVLHIPLRAGWKFLNLRAVLTKVFTRRPSPSGGEMVPCDTWDNATLLCEACDAQNAVFPLTAKMMRIAPGETDTWYLSIKGTDFSASFNTRNPRALFTMPYQPGEPQCWREESLGYESVYKTITGGIFEFGFGDAVLQMIAAFCHQIDQGPEAVLPFGCATLSENQMTHTIFTAALQSHQQCQVVTL